MTLSDDHHDITALLYAYCDLLDSGDLDGCARLFQNGAWGVDGDLASGTAAVRAVLSNVTLYNGVPNTRHLTSNVLIKVSVDGLSATVRSCITVMQCVPEDFPMQAIFIGTYHDLLSKQDDRWAFQERKIIPNLVGDMSRHRTDMA
jgi:hypothetical protein